MRAVILHGASSADHPLEAVQQQLVAQLQAKGWDVSVKRLAEMTIRPCTGCFNCWLKNPGECVVADDGREMAKAFVQHDAIIVLTPVTFGGYSGLLKTGMDRIVPTVSPLFMVYHGEMHHRLRYPNPPRFFGVGWQAKADAEGAATFTTLIQRNALNLHAPASASIVLHDAQSAEERARLLAGMITRMEVRQ